MRTEGGKLSVIGYDSKLPEFLPLWAKANGADLISEDGRTAQLDDPEVVEALEFAVGHLRRAGRVQQGQGVPRLRRLLRRGQPVRHERARRHADGAVVRQRPQRRRRPTPRWRSTPFRDHGGRAASPIASGSAWAIPKGSGNPEAACRFAKTMTAIDSWIKAAEARVDARAEDGRPFTGLLTGNTTADEQIQATGRAESATSKWDTGVEATLRGQRQHVRAAGEPGRRGVQDRLAGRREPGPQRPAGAAGGDGPGPGGGAGRARRSLGDLGRGADRGDRPSASEPRPRHRGSPPGAGRRGRIRRETRAALLFISPWIVGFLVFTAWPVIYSGYLSFTDYDVINAPSFVGFDNYRQLFEDPKVALALRNTFIFTAMLGPAARASSSLAPGAAAEPGRPRRPASSGRRSSSRR